LFTSSERARALETGEYTQDASADIPKAVAPVAAPVAAAPKVVEVKIEAAPTASTSAQTIGSSSDLLESMGIKSDAPLCMTCGVKMRMSGACFVCEGCGNTSGCS
jgi:ribonucleoside-diphosphate reductase alpha chain